MEETQAPARLSTARWFREGLRSGWLLQSRVAGHQPAPLQLLLVIGGVVALELALARLEVPGRARFDLRGWLVPAWSGGLSALLVWAALWGRQTPGADRPSGVASWFMLSFASSVPLLLVGGALNIAEAYDAMPTLLTSPVPAWALFIAIIAWGTLVQLWLGVQFGLRRGRLAGLTLAMLALSLVTIWYFNDRPWEAVADPGERRPRLSLSQETFERQQALWKEQVKALAPQREGVVDVYGLVFAPYAYEDVFLRESGMVADVLAERFDAQGRVLRLLNHATTADSLPWATPLNLKRAVAALAERMDREHDLLVVYLTSHGASNFRLAAEHWPLQVPWLTPQDLREALDAAGIRHRVVAVSACYSGGWVQPLAGDTTLVMTAADPDHTSYGCGRKSELTFFGRAVFHEQLRSTHSFEEAFAAAVPVIRRREEEAGKPDGFSNPQISVGAQIRPVLDALARRLDAAAQPAAAQ